MRDMLRAFLGAALSLHLAACGTILHPERKGQTGGRLDAGVVVLDAVGLLFFLIPGVIAFAVDFSNGTIYLPGTRRARFDPRKPRKEELERVLARELGRQVDLDAAEVAVLRPEDEGPVLASLASRFD